MPVYVQIYILLGSAYCIFLVIDKVVGTRRELSTRNCIEGIVLQKENHGGKYSHVLKMGYIIVTIETTAGKKYSLVNNIGLTSHYFKVSNLKDLQNISLYKKYRFEYFVSRFNVSHIISFNPVE